MDAAAAEAMALLRGLQFLKKLGCSSAIIESDSVELVQACNGEIEVWTSHAAILAEIVMKARMMDTVEFRHCMRDSNQVAHELAKQVYRRRILAGRVTPQFFFFLL